MEGYAEWTSDLAYGGGPTHGAYLLYDKVAAHLRDGETRVFVNLVKPQPNPESRLESMTDGEPAYRVGTCFRIAYWIVDPKELR